MTTDEEQILAAAKRFYGAIEEVATGKGVDAIKETWHQTADVTSAHPTGEWMHGWDEILASWQVFASFGREGAGGSKIRDLRAHYSGGDLAYTTGVFVAGAGFGGASMNVTNVLQRVNGVWKIVHHHADKAPTLEAAMEKLADD